LPPGRVLAAVQRWC